MITLAEMLRTSHWAKALTAGELARVERDIVERTFPAGSHVCRKGEPALQWIGIVDGLV